MLTTVSRTSVLDETMADARLMLRVIERDRQAFATILQRHHRRCFQLAWRVTADRQESEDILQDVFFGIWQRPERYDATKGIFGAWLTRVVVNAALDRRRRIKPVDHLDDIATLASPEPTPQAMAEAQDLQNLLADLPPRQRAVVSLFYLEGYTMAEIAVMLDTSVDAIESLLSRGRQALRAIVKQGDSDYKATGEPDDR